VQRQKKPEDFERLLEKPVPLPMSAYVNFGAAVTEYELEADGASFMAFASALGIAPPKRLGPAVEEPEDVPSSPSP
jgi:hypothetical protein